MSNQEAEAFIKKLDEGLAIAEQEMLRDKASRGESVVYSDSQGNIKHVLASDVLAGRVLG
ncbi:ribosome recycling factor [Hallella mizrahii]|uniref:Ribosome recycling factor n=1 Tax=Hallella mizrahii TaxID=2606637 RepID=A0A7K0KF95_9BACT|nr:ribosome recycling factor [Hallella mizrahii]MST84090.1 ribosome recycling factor [Hallella mizrahii]